MKIITLVENMVYKSGLVAEHGLSFYIETNTKKILFDTGQTAALIANAKLLGVDIADIDCVVISHGHLDHTGGLYAFLEENTKAIVYAKKEAFEPKYRSDSSFIGIEYLPKALDKRIRYVTETTEIEKGIFIVPQIPIANLVDTHFEKLRVRKNGTLHNDTFEDELFLAILKNEKLSVISSCSHRGITNIIREAIHCFNLPVNLILGGFHTQDCTIEQHQEITKYFESISPEMMGVCHCTGIEEYAKLRNECNFKVFYSHTGNVVSLK